MSSISDLWNIQNAFFQRNLRANRTKTDPKAQAIKSGVYSRGFMRPYQQPTLASQGGQPRDYDLMVDAHEFRIEREQVLAQQENENETAQAFYGFKMNSTTSTNLIKNTNALIREIQQVFVGRTDASKITHVFKLFNDLSYAYNESLKDITRDIDFKRLFHGKVIQIETLFEKLYNRFSDWNAKHEFRYNSFEPNLSFNTDYILKIVKDILAVCKLMLEDKNTTAFLSDSDFNRLEFMNNGQLEVQPNDIMPIPDPVFGDEGDDDGDGAPGPPPGPPVIGPGPVPPPGPLPGPVPPAEGPGDAPPAEGAPASGRSGEPALEPLVAPEYEVPLPPSEWSLIQKRDYFIEVLNQINHDMQSYKNEGEAIKNRDRKNYRSLTSYRELRALYEAAEKAFNKVDATLGAIEQALLEESKTAAPPPRTASHPSHGAEYGEEDYIPIKYLTPQGVAETPYGTSGLPNYDLVDPVIPGPLEFDDDDDETTTAGPGVAAPPTVGPPPATTPMAGPGHGPPPAVVSPDSGPSPAKIPIDLAHKSFQENTIRLNQNLRNGFKITTDYYKTIFRLMTFVFDRQTNTPANAFPQKFWRENSSDTQLFDDFKKRVNSASKKVIVPVVSIEMVKKKLETLGEAYVKENLARLLALYKSKYIDKF
jgi:hypothetical protein